MTLSGIQAQHAHEKLQQMTPRHHSTTSQTYQMRHLQSIAHQERNKHGLQAEKGYQSISDSILFNSAHNLEGRASLCVLQMRCAIQKILKHKICAFSIRFK